MRVYAASSWPRDSLPQALILSIRTIISAWVAIANAQVLAILIQSV